jgi:hypothetical protein
MATQDNMPKEEIDTEDIKKIGDKQDQFIASPGKDFQDPIAIEEKDPDKRKLKEQTIVDKISKKFDQWSAWRRPYEKVWDECYRLYFSSTDKLKTPTRSSVTVPIIFQIIETALPKIINVIFSSNEDFFECVPTDPAELERTNLVELLLAYQLAQADFFEKFMDFTKQLLMYGTSYLKVYWKVVRKWVVARELIREPVSIMGFKLKDAVYGKEKKEYKVVERRPEVDVIDILDVFPDPEARSERDSEGVIIRSWINIDQLKELGAGKYPVYANVDSEDIKPDKASFTSSRHVRYAIRGTSSGNAVDAHQVELLEYWGYWDLDGDGIREECYIVVANRKVLVKAIGNPFDHQKRPLVRAVMFPIPMEWFGIGLIEPVINNVHELWTIRRQRLDNINQALNRMWKANALADLDPDMLVSSPGGILWVDQLTDVEPLEQNNVTDQAFTEAAMIQTEIKDALIPDSAMGTPQTGRLGRTARGAQMIIGQALEKFGTAIKLIEEMALKRVLRMFYQLDLQFLDEDEVFEKTGLYGHIFDREITPEMIRAEFEIKIVAVSDIVDKESKINRIISFMGIFGKVLSPDSILSLAKKVWKLMGFNKDEISLTGVSAQPVQGNVVDGNLSNAVSGQVGTNGAETPMAAPKETPNV